jgi:hypothetical protein
MYLQPFDKRHRSDAKAWQVAIAARHLATKRFRRRQNRFKETEHATDARFRRAPDGGIQSCPVRMRRTMKPIIRAIAAEGEH